MDCHAYKTGGGYAQRSCFGAGCHDVTHLNGIDDPASANFHGKLLSTTGYNMEPCKKCHGAVFDGGTSGYSCDHPLCHTQADGGPAACYNCHGDWNTKQSWPNTPSHRTHLLGGLTTNTKVACSGCHKVPNSYTDPGHIDPTQIVTFSDPLAFTHTNGTVGTPSYNDATKKCSNIYCHGNFTNGNNLTVVWNGLNQIYCGACHGQGTDNPMPKPPHPASDNCSLCHAGVIDASKAIIDKDKHINGKLNKFGSEETNW
jgi:predicted CxxxxCH...CXXCH cytochrome family protein